MKNTCLLSQDAKTYLCCYYQTLDGMVQTMTTARLTQSVSHNFVVQMVPHHRAAVQMCENILRFTRDQAVRRLAQRAAGQLSLRVGQLEDVLEPCARLASPQTDLRLYQRRTDLICRDMYAEMGRLPEHNALAALFLRQALPLCRGAFRMAENALKYDVPTELVPVLRAICAQQRQQAAQMRALLGRQRR